MIRTSRFLLLGALLLALLLAGCAQPPVQPAPTPTPEPTAAIPTPTQEAATPTVPAASSDIGLSPADISLDGQGLVERWQAVAVPATPYDNMHAPGPSGLPAHIQVLFNGVTDPRKRPPGDPVIYIIPVEAYRQMWDEHESRAVSDELRKIDEYIQQLPEPSPVRGMPVLPLEETFGINDFVTQLRPAEGGFRFVGRFAMDATPLTNEGLRYIYQGLAGDGKWLVAFFFPVRTDELPDGLEAVSPEDEKAFQEDGLGYLAAQSKRLDALPGDAWDPDLARLDALIASLEIR